MATSYYKAIEGVLLVAVYFAFYNVLPLNSEVQQNVVYDFKFYDVPQS